MVNTGEGKGKTTSALGTAIRANGSGLKVCIIQFMKGLLKAGERDVINKISNIEIHAMGSSFSWTKESWDEDRALAQRAMEKSKEVIYSGDFDLVVLDEINYALGYGLLEVNEVIELLKNKPHNIHLFLTGRGTKKEIIDIADMVTEMKEIKHHFRNGVKAQKGIEF